MTERHPLKLFLPEGAVVRRALIKYADDPNPYITVFDPAIEIMITGSYILGHNEDGNPILTLVEEGHPID